MALVPFRIRAHLEVERWKEELELTKEGEKDAERKGKSGRECRQKLVLRQGGRVTFTVILAESQVSSVRRNNMAGSRRAENVPFQVCVCFRLVHTPRDSLRGRLYLNLLRMSGSTTLCQFLSDAESSLTDLGFTV